jgi:hypothetical protein
MRSSTSGDQLAAPLATRTPIQSAPDDVRAALRRRSARLNWIVPNPATALGLRLPPRTSCNPILGGGGTLLSLDFTVPRWVKEIPNGWNQGKAEALTVEERRAIPQTPVRRARGARLTLRRPGTSLEEAGGAQFSNVRPHPERSPGGRARPTADNHFVGVH